MKLEEVLQEHNISFRRQSEDPHVTSGWIGLECPRCGPDSGVFHYGYHIASGRTNCWKCGFVPLWEFLREKIHPAVVQQILADLDREGIQTTVPPQGRLQLPNGIGLLLPAHRRYLQGRGFDPDELAEKWAVQGIGLSASLSWRLFIPIQYRGKTVSWTTRSLSDVGTRYVAAKVEQEAIPHRSLLFGIDHCRHAVVVVEGCLDAMRIGYGAVATCGIGYSHEQFHQISKFPTRVIAFDSEPDAQKRARKLTDDLQLHPGETYRIILSAKDAASAEDREIQQLRKYLR